MAELKKLLSTKTCETNWASEIESHKQMNRMQIPLALHLHRLFAALFRSVYHQNPPPVKHKIAMQHSPKGHSTIKNRDRS